MPTTTLGQYEIRSRIGSGGMGDVYDAMHTGLNRRVAIKTLRRRYLDDDTVVARFLREGQLASRIRHPNIVDVTDVGMIGGLPCLVMEHLEGEPFGAMIKRGGALGVAAAVDLLLPIVAAVDYAHERGVLHRDIKPSNIFIARTWNGDVTPKILDFGISKLVDESQQAALTTDSAFVGTPHYASPEAMRAEKTTDGRSDQYSMGVVFYEATTGTKPFFDKGGNFVALAMAICAGEFPPPRQLKPDLPAAFESVVLRAMSLRSEERFPSMRAFGEALLGFASDRARMIWGPTFAGAGAASDDAAAAAAALPRDGTQVILRPSATSASVSSSAAPSAFSVTGPSGFPIGAGTPHSGMHPSLFSAHTGPPLPPVTDRTPSYSLAGGSLPGYAPTAKASRAGSVMLGAMLVATLLVGGLAVVKFTGGPKAVGALDSPTGATVTSAASPAEGTYAVTISVSPANASVELDGVAVGAGAIHRTLPKDGRQHALRVSAPGHETVYTTFDEHRPPPSSIALRPASAGAPAAASHAPASSPAGRGDVRPIEKASGSSHGGGSGGGKQTGSGKNPDNRPRTDNIDPWE